MIRVHLWSWTKCAWFWAWRPVAVVRAMRHLTLIGTLACTGITIFPPSPPVEAHGPPPAIITPPPTAWLPPGQPWTFPPAWGATPPTEGLYPPATPIPLGPLVPQPPFPPVETLEQPPPIEVAMFAPPLCPPELPLTTVVAHPVPEPSALALIGFGLAALAAFHLARRSKPVVPNVRWRVITQEGE